MSQKRIAVAPVLIILALLVLPQEAFSASLGPSWGTYEYGEFAKSLIVHRDSLVQQKLRSIAPVQDAAHFAQNLLKAYEAASQLPIMDKSEEDYFGAHWMDTSEVLRYNRGDCKNHAILLATLIEALYENTFGYLPRDLIWIMGGLVDLGRGPGGHVWALLNMDRIRSVSQDAFDMIRNTPITTGKATVSVGARPPWNRVVEWVTANLDLFVDRVGRKFSLSIIQVDQFYVELEPTWRLSISEFYYKKYPAVELHDQWNSYEYHKEPKVTPPGAGSLWLSSTAWRHGDTVSWSAQGLTPNGAVSVKIQGSWGSIGFPDVTANSRGEAGFSFVVGSNVLGSGRFVAIDRVTNSFLMKDYSLIQQATQRGGTAQVVDAWWTVGGARVTQAGVGQTVRAHFSVRAVGGSVDGELTVRVKKDWVAAGDTDYMIGSTRISLQEGQVMELWIQFVPDQKSSLTFRGFFIHVDLSTWGTSWTMPTGYPPRLRVV